MELVSTSDTRDRDRSCADKKRKHKKRTRSKGKRKHAFVVCSKKFKSLDALDQHQRSKAHRGILLGSLPREYNRVLDEQEFKRSWEGRQVSALWIDGLYYPATVHEVDIRGRDLLYFTKFDSFAESGWLYSSSLQLKEEYKKPYSCQVGNLQLRINKWVDFQRRNGEWCIGVIEDVSVEGSGCSPEGTDDMDTPYTTVDLLILFDTGHEWIDMTISDGRDRVVEFRTHTVAPSAWAAAAAETPISPSALAAAAAELPFFDAERCAEVSASPDNVNRRGRFIPVPEEKRRKLKSEYAQHRHRHRQDASQDIPLYDPNIRLAKVAQEGTILTGPIGVPVSYGPATGVYDDPRRRLAPIRGKEARVDTTRERHLNLPRLEPDPSTSTKKSRKKRARKGGLFGRCKSETNRKAEASQRRRISDAPYTHIVRSHSGVKRMISALQERKMNVRKAPASCATRTATSANTLRLAPRPPSRSWARRAPLLRGSSSAHPAFKDILRGFTESCEKL